MLFSLRLSSGLLGALLISACARQPFDLNPDGAAAASDAGMDAGSSADAGHAPVDSGSHVDAASGSDAGACADQDTDGVCDTADNCPAVANADQADADTDGVGDACEPCSADGIAATVDTGAVSVSDVKLGGDSNVTTVAPGANVVIKFSYALDPCTAVPSLYHQIVIGLDDVSAPVCARNTTCSLLVDKGTATQSLTAPTERGDYYVLVDVAQGLDASCPYAWSGAQPMASSRIALMCVR